MDKNKSSIKKLGIVTNFLQLDEQDTFFLFVNEAISRHGLEVFAFNTCDLSKLDVVTAKRINEPLTFRTRAKLNGKKIIMKLSDFDLIFLKKDPPVDTCYKHLLNTLLAKKIPTVNHPKGILKIGTKAYLKHFPELTPRTFYANEAREALESIKKLGNCVVKKSDSFGGKGVKHIRYNSNEFYGYNGKKEVMLSEADIFKIIEKYLKNSIDNTVLIVEYFLSASKRGDKRVVVVEGDILGSYIRLPNVEKGICVSANNGAKLCDPTKRDREIVRTLRPHFKKYGIDLAALDLLMNRDGVEHLSEINVFNPGFCNLDVVHHKLHIAKKIIDMLCRKMR